MEKAIWFDMDGTIANLYGVENWLEYLINEDTKPYEIAKPLINMNSLARLLNKLKRNGYTVNIISWTAKNGTEEYNEKVKVAKMNWLKNHLKSVEFNSIDIVPYGTPKGENRNGILFDDEMKNRMEWNGIALNVNDIIETLKTL